MICPERSSFNTFELANRMSVVAVGPISEIQVAGLTCPLFTSGWLILLMHLLLCPYHQPKAFEPVLLGGIGN